MKRYLLLLLFISFIFTTIAASGQAVSEKPEAVRSAELLVVGGGASGVSAGIQASRMGVHTIIIEEHPWLGGMLTSAGVSAIDGNYNLRAGFWGEFLEALVQHYGSYDALKTGWVSNVQFEPSVGNAILKAKVANEENVEVIYGYHPVSIVKDEKGLWVLEAEDEKGERLVLRADFVIDATELGDVAKMAGIPYDIGMESRLETGEDVAPEKSNNIVQDLTYVAILKDYGKPSLIEMPAGYNEADFACCCANPKCINPKEPDRVWSKEEMLSYGALPNGKYMINWPIEGNDYYVNLIDMSREERAAELQKAKNFTMGLIYFMQHDLGFCNLGLADDEYPTEDLMPFIPYHRESRRIHGLVRFTCNHAQAPYSQAQPLYRTNIAVGDYPVDHHHTRYSGYEELPRLYFHPIPSYGLPLGTLIPKGVDNFIVAEKSISVSNIINGCTRLQPVVIQIGTAAGALAATALHKGVTPSEVSVREVQKAILDCGGYLQPCLDAEKDSPMFAPLQRIASTGILKGVGRKVEWTNQFWLRADELLLHSELDGLKEVYPYFTFYDMDSDKPVTAAELAEILKNLATQEKIMGRGAAAKAVRKAMEGIDSKAYVTRGQYALLVDKILDPFGRKPVDFEGNYIYNN